MTFGDLIRMQNTMMKTNLNIKKLSLKRILIVLLLSISGVIFFSCQPKHTAHLETVEIENGWGYQIKVDGKVYIDQANIPAITGHSHFQSKDDAEKVGRLVLKKLRDGKIPAVSKQELDSLQIKY